MLPVESVRLSSLLMLETVGSVALILTTLEGGEMKGCSKLVAK